MILMRDCVLRDSVMGESLLCTLARLAATATAATPASASASPSTFALVFDTRFAFCFGGGKLRLVGIRVSSGDFFFGVLGWLARLGLLRGKAARRLRRMHLLAAVDHIRLLAGNRGVSRNGDYDAEALLQRA